MLEAILSTLSIMGWLGIILAILVGKAVVFYIAASLVSVAFTMLPYINEMITNSFGTVLLSSELLTTLSSIGVLGVVVSAIVVQGKKAIANTVKLANMSGNTEEITWKVEEE